MNRLVRLDRREFLELTGLTAGGLLLGVRPAISAQTASSGCPSRAFSRSGASSSGSSARRFCVKLAAIPTWCSTPASS